MDAADLKRISGATALRRLWLSLGVSFVFASLPGCKPTPPPPPSQAALDLWKQFDGQMAYAHVEKLVAFGARPPGTEAHRKMQAYLVEELKKLGLRVEEHKFTADTPRGKVEFNNIIAWLDAGRDILLLGSHYDTKWYDEFVFVGANDAGSSTGALLEAARVLAANKGALRDTVAMVFFDGEECFVRYTQTDGFYGSRRLIADWKKDGTLGRIKAMLHMDMVGDRDLTLTLSLDDDPTLATAAMDAAEALGARHKVKLMSGAGLINDDHTLFKAEGIPALNLMDFEFGSQPGLNDYWHTSEDTLDKVSAESLLTVGRLLLKLVPVAQSMPSRRP
jgi:acetylornithine deacetylase/succinyl-diaminopimelate desuccinylase-like protein